MTTYTALRYQDNLYLVREPVLEEPKIPITMDEREERGLLGKYDKDLAAYHAQFTSAILVPKEHEHLFEGRTGMVEGKDFETDIVNDGIDRNGEKKYKQVAIPKEPGAGEESQKIFFYALMKKFIDASSEAGKIDWNNDTDRSEFVSNEVLKSFHITRKNP